MNGNNTEAGPAEDSWPASSEWQPVTDRASGHTYWWNVNTGETRWDAPEQPAEAEPGVAAVAVGTDAGVSTVADTCTAVSSAEDIHTLQKATVGASTASAAPQPTTAAAVVHANGMASPERPPLHLKAFPGRSRGV